MLVCGKNFDDIILDKIRSTIASEPSISRQKLSRMVCSWLNWNSLNGKPAAMSCRVALLKLQKQGAIQLPAALCRIPRAGEGTKIADDILPQREAIACSLNKLGTVKIERINSRYSKSSRLWMAVMRQHHYLGAGPLCGSQIRYLITCEGYGLLGGMSFSAASWRVQGREQWIGWSDAARKAHLHQVVNNSRFLIMPDVRVPHLASHVLSLSVKRLSADWRQRYGYEPILLETFVEHDRFKGTSYRAANWHFAGQTKGRGRQDRAHQKSVAVKDVYLYPLRNDFRQMLCLEQTDQPVQAVNHHSPAPIRDGADWVEDEFGGVDLGDKRLERRIKIIARDFYERPQANVPEACSTRAKTKAAYRFFENSATTMEKELQSHIQQTVARINTVPLVLAVQDTTELNYATHPMTEGLGYIGTNKDGAVGLVVHDTIAFTPEGVALGIVNVQCWARVKDDFGKRERRHKVPIEQKESNKWLLSYKAVEDVQKRCPNTQLVCVGDRESDIYELFAMAQANPAGPKLLVRARHDRMLTQEQGHLWASLAAMQKSGSVEVRVPRRGNRPARDALLDIRFSKITVQPPYDKSRQAQVVLCAIFTQEHEAPEGADALEWMLLTTLEVNTFEDAARVLKLYCRRWSIEVYHKTLKSGCKIESRQLGSAQGIKACLAIDMVIAWRILRMVMLGRETPNVPCSVFFEEHEWKALVFYHTRNPQPPEKPPTLRDTIRLIATLGGFLGRKGDGEPGTKTLWTGLQRLDDLSAMYKFMAQVHVPHLLGPSVSSPPRYG